MDKVQQELVQRLYEEDGHAGNIYKKAPIPMLRFYESKAQEIIEKNCEPPVVSEAEPSYQHLKNILGIKEE